MPATHLRKWVSVLASPVQLPLSALGKAVEYGLSAWAPVSHVRDMDGILSSQVQHDPTLAIVAICEVNHQMEDFLPQILKNKIWGLYIPSECSLLLSPVTDSVLATAGHPDMEARCRGKQIAFSQTLFSSDSSP